MSFGNDGQYWHGVQIRASGGVQLVTVILMIIVGQQVCYRDIVKEYGSDKWNYPDVTYLKAPVVKNF